MTAEHRCPDSTCDFPLVKADATHMSQWLWDNLTPEQREHVHTCYQCGRIWDMANRQGPESI